MMRYASEAHLLSTEYVALEINNQSCYTPYATTEDNGYDNLTELLEKNGYQLIASLEDTMAIYKKAVSYPHIP